MNDKGIKYAYYILLIFNLICVLSSIFYKSEQYYVILFALCLLNQTILLRYIEFVMSFKNI